MRSILFVCTANICRSPIAERVFRKMLPAAGVGEKLEIDSIGTHVLCALAAAGRRCISVDNYSNSSPKSIERVLQIAPGSVEAVEVDVRDEARLASLIAGRDIDSVIHLAGLKAVGESVDFPR